MPSARSYKHRPRTWATFFRDKDVVAPGGTQHRQVREHNRWQHYGTYKSRDAADDAKDRLMEEGYHAVVERLGGGRDVDRMTVADLLEMLEADDTWRTEE